jgi:hypothetical protein
VKPGDFLIGVLDFFAILLPGGMATWLVTRYIPRPALESHLGLGSSPDPLTVWIVFFLSAYVLGHFVFMAGSRLDPIYDRWRERKKPTEDDDAFQAARKLRNELTADLQGPGFSVLKWCRAYIQIHAPGARAEIDRLEADSKFFRGMIVIALMFTAHFLLTERSPLISAACIGLGTLAYSRYREQRWKMTELSYGTAVILGATRPPAASRPCSADGGEAD